jgi:uncharacterized small protein (TIGR04563 family)
MNVTEKRKQSLYFTEAMLLEIQAEANRLDRSMSWVVQYAWKHGVFALRKIPAMDEVSG